MELSKEEKGLADLEVALSLIPEYDKEDYLTALRLAPQLVATESDPRRFLRFTNYNAPAAAQIMIRYWATRREVYRERAFLPFRFTGNGALEGDVVNIIRSGVSLTPITDDKGRSVAFYDISRRVIFCENYRRKYMFYWLQIMMENDMTQSEGIIVVVVVRDWEPDLFPAQNIFAFLNVFPVKIKVFHFVQSLASDGRASQLAARFRGFIVQSYARFVRCYCVRIHHTNDDRGIAASLAEYGIGRDIVPVALGGRWSYRQMHEWIEVRRVRDCMFAGEGSIKEITKFYDRSKLQVPCSRLPPKKRLKLATTSLNTQDVGDRSSIECLSNPERMQRMFVEWRKCLVEHSGANVAWPADDNFQSFFWRYLRSCILDRFPRNEVEAILDASKNAPSRIWEKESNPYAFLLVDDYHVLFIARRLAKYWKLRSGVFRANKYKLLHQTGEGALKQKSDLATLKTGFVQLLPNDTNGCPVIFIDPSRLVVERSRSKQTAKSCLFYMFSLAAENGKAQDDGIVVVLRFAQKAPIFEKSAQGRIQAEDSMQPIDVSFLEDLRTSLPVRIQAVHAVLEGHDASLAARVANRLSGVGDKVYTHVVSSNRIESIPLLLKKFGIGRESLPRCWNGSWGDSQFTLWQELRIRIEWQIPLGLSGRSNVGFPAMRVSEVLSDKAERERRLSVVHAWRKRARFQSDKCLLDEQRLDLLNEQKKLRKEGDSLEYLLQCAYELLHQQGGGD